MTRPWLALFIGAILLLPLSAAAQEAKPGDDDEESHLRLRAELEVLKREVKELRARVRLLERLVESRKSEARPVTGEVSDELGLVVEGGPRGDAGADSVLKLPLLLHHAITHGKSVDDLRAFGEVSFLVPDALWQRVAGKGRVIRGLPTRGELDLGLEALRRLGPESSVAGVEPMECGTDERAVRAVVVRVAAPGAAEARFVLTGVKLSGRWFVAHLLAESELQRAQELARDVAISAVTYRIFRQAPPRDLQALARDRETLETHENLKRAGLKFPFGAWLDRLKTLGWDWSGNELTGPLYRIKLDESEVVVSPRGASYPALRARHADLAPGAAVEVRTEHTTR